MPTTPSPSTAPDVRRARIARLDRMAEALDARFRIFGIPVGWDSILGLIPGVGDVVTAAPGAVMIYEGYRMGARKRTMARMAINTGVDMIVGGIPLIGDAFDVVFKSHRRNMTLLKRELVRIEAGEHTKERRPQTWQSENDRRTDAETPTGYSEKRVPLTRRDGMAAHSSATSPAKTR